MTLLILAQNRILGSLHDFEVNCLHTNLEGKLIILLFTHLDLFEAEIRKIPFKDHFPEYTGPQDDSILAREFIAQKFRDVRKVPTISKVFFANATDTEEFPTILSEIEDLIYRERHW